MTTQQQIDDLHALRIRLKSDVVPGVMHCARCKFRLQRVNLYVNVGAVGAGDNDTEPCPNGCGPLWPVTWEQEAREGYKLAEDLFERAKRAEDALRELVALKDIKDECVRVRQRRPCSVTRIFPQDLLDAEADYKQRKPKAWDAARAVLLGPNVRGNRPAAPAAGPVE
jgi:hypothetical protein